MAPIATGLGLDAKKESDLVALAQFHLNENSKNRHTLNQLLIDEFSDLKNPTENHEVIARLPIRTVWTTNYDKLIEKAFDDSGKRVDVKYSKEQLATTKRGRDVTVYKMHGDIDHPDKAILTRDDYEGYHQTHAPFVTALAGQLVSTTFSFLGFSFSDPNLDYVLSRIRITFENNQRGHFNLMKKRSRQKGEKRSEFEYAERRQTLMINDLKRFNIKTLLLEDYSEITEILKTIERRYRARTVYISGAAVEFGRWGRGETENFVRAFAGYLTKQNFKIATGLGMGIGNFAVTGAIEQIYSRKDRSFEDNLLVRPFPIGISDRKKREDTYKSYRKEITTAAGICVFLLGNKKDGSIINSEGVRKEFELARASGSLVVPVGASGYMAKELWDKVMADFATYFPSSTTRVRKLMTTIGDDSLPPAKTLSALTELIQQLSED